VDCNHILLEVEWRWWWSKWCWNAKSQIAYDLQFALWFQLCLITIWIWERICRGGFGKSCSPWCCLGWGANIWQSLV
jgi:hypothetical protein